MGTRENGEIKIEFLLEMSVKSQPLTTVYMDNNVGKLPSDRHQLIIGRKSGLLLAVGKIPPLAVLWHLPKGISE